MILECETQSNLLVKNLSAENLVLSPNAMFLATMNNKLTIFDLKTRTNKDKPLLKFIIDLKFYYENLYILYLDESVEVINIHTFQEIYRLEGVQMMYLNEQLNLEAFFKSETLEVKNKSNKQEEFSLKLQRKVKRNVKLSAVCQRDDFSNRLYLYLMNDKQIQIIDLTNQVSAGVIALPSPNIQRVIKINYRPKIVDNKLNFQDLNPSSFTFGSINSLVSQVICPGEVFTPSQTVFIEAEQMLAVYSKIKQTLYDISFNGNNISLIRKYYIGVDTVTFRYGTHSNVGLFLFNKNKNVESIKLCDKGEKKESIQVEKKQKKMKVMQRESKTIKPSNQPSISQQKIVYKQQNLGQNDKKEDQLQKIDIKSNQAPKQQPSKSINPIVNSNNPFLPSNSISNTQSQAFNNTFFKPNPQSSISQNMFSKQFKNQFADNNAITNQKLLNAVQAQESPSSSKQKPVQSENKTQIQESNKHLNSSLLQQKIKPPSDSKQPNEHIVEQKQQSIKPNKFVTIFSQNLKQRLINSSKSFKQSLQSQSKRIQDAVKNTTQFLKQEISNQIVQQSKSQMTKFLSQDLHSKLQKYFQQIFLKVSDTYQAGHKFSERQYNSQKQKYDLMSTELIDKRSESLQNLFQEAKQFLSTKNIELDNVSHFQQKIEHLIKGLKGVLQGYNNATSNRQRIDELLDEKLVQLQKVIGEFKQKQKQKEGNISVRKRTDSINSSSKGNSQPKKFFILRKKGD